MNRTITGMAGVIAPFAAAAASWAAIGHLEEPGVVDPDYMIEPILVSPGVRITLLCVGVVVLVGCCGAIWRALRCSLITHREAAAVFPAIGIGLFLAVAARVVTAGGIGANIGGGLVVMAAPFVLLSFAVLIAALLAL